jgi:hypothetical protein
VKSFQLGMDKRFEKPLRSQQNYYRHCMDFQPTSLDRIREHEKLCHMLGINYRPLIRSEKCESRADLKFTSEYKGISIVKALEYILAQMEKGKEPTPEMVSLHVGIKSRPLGTQLSKIGVKSMATRRQGQGIRIYPLSMKLKIKDILKILNGQEPSMLLSNYSQDY